MKGSWPVLAVLAVLMVAAFYVQRSRSTFLRIEADQALAQELAASSGLEASVVMSLRELLGLATPAAELRIRCQEFAALAHELGEPLAAEALTGHAAEARAALQAAGGDAARAFSQLRARQGGLAGVRFQSLRERFAARRGG